MINVTKTFFPPIEEYNDQIQRIWDNRWLTNNGELCKELANKLQSYLGVHNIIPMTNGTLPIQIALNLFGNRGEIITTPFSYVATTASIVWEKCTPIFVDIHPKYLTIDESKIEPLITNKTTAILATHVYGNPCHVDAIEAIADSYNLKVIYDAAHCFGVTYNGQSIFNYGDVSTCSFHATKLFHTGEGGALFCKDELTYKEIWYRHNFGHDGTERFHGLGINGKMSELQAAMGLSILPYMQHITNQRKKICDFYEENLKFNKLKKIKIRKNTKWNYSYYPIIFESQKKLLEVKSKLEQQNIFPRRYFFPSLELLPYIDSSGCSIALDISKKVLCLPLFAEFNPHDFKLICDIINKNLK